MLLPPLLGCICLGIYPAGWNIFMSYFHEPQDYFQFFILWVIQAGNSCTEGQPPQGTKVIISEKPPEIKSEIKWFSVILILVSMNKMTVEVCL